MTPKRTTFVVFTKSPSVQGTAQGKSRQAACQEATYQADSPTLKTDPRSLRNGVPQHSQASRNAETCTKERSRLTRDPNLFTFAAKHCYNSWAVVSARNGA